MTEAQKMIIEMFHSTHSLLRTCREDLSIMIEQHGRNALLPDRITESARRLDKAMESLPHMAGLIEAVDTEAEDDALEAKLDARLESETSAADEAEAAATGADEAEAAPDGADGISRPADTDTPEPEPEVDD